MPSAYNQEKNKTTAGRDDIGGLDGRARQPPAGQQGTAQADRPGTRRGADAGARRAIRRQDLQHARRRRAARNFDRDVVARHHRSRVGRGTAARIRLAACRPRAPCSATTTPPSACCSNTCRPSASAASWTRSADRPAATCGRSSPTCRKRCWRTISRTNTRRPWRWCCRKLRAEHAARVLAILPRGLLARRGQPHAEDGGGAEGSDRARRTDAAHRIHVQPVADPPARRARGDGGNLQQFRPHDRNALPDRAGRRKPRRRRAHQGADVHLRRPGQARHAARRRR